jgi:hypothetical protein
VCNSSDILEETKLFACEWTDIPLMSFTLQRGSEHLIKREERRKNHPGFHLPLDLGGHYIGHTHGDSLQWHEMHIGMTEWRLCGCLLTGRIWKVIFKKEISYSSLYKKCLSRCCLQCRVHNMILSSIMFICNHPTYWTLQIVALFEEEVPNSPSAVSTALHISASHYHYRLQNGNNTLKQETIH